MKRAKRTFSKPRNPFVVVAIQKKAGAHQRVDKRASRARQRQMQKRELNEEQ